MNSSNSFIKTAIERIRTYMDEPATDGKYSDDFIVRHVLMPATSDVWSRLMQGAQTKLVLSLSITLDGSVAHYQLPPMVGEIWRLAQYDSYNRLVQEWLPESFWHQSGPGWAIQGNVLTFKPLPPSGQVWTVEYVPTMDFLMHYATDGNLSTSTTFILSSNPALGPLDLRDNAYAGAILRILGASRVEERIIESYDESTRTCTLRVAAETATGSGVTYEVVPACSQSLAETVAICGAIKLSTYRKVPAKDMEQLTVQYRSSIKTLLDRWNAMAMRRTKSWITPTIDKQQLSTW